MKTTLKLATLVLVASGALALAGNAFAMQTIAVSGTSSSTTIKVSQAQTDAQPAKITIFVPTGYVLNATAAPGTNIGTTSGQVFARDLGVPLPLTGNVIVADPAAHTKDVCSPGDHAAVWDLQLTVAGNTIHLFVYVSATTGAQTALGAAKLEVCLGPADVPAGTPNRSPNGAQLLEATFTVNNTLTAPIGPTRWTSFWTPYAAGSPLPNPAGTVEARALTGPGSVSIVARITNKKKKLVRITGSVTQSGDKVGGATVRLLINSKGRFSAKSGANGGYTFRLKNTSKKVRTTFFQTTATADARDVTATGCANPTQPPIPCVSATIGPFTAQSKKVKIRL